MYRVYFYIVIKNALDKAKKRMDVSSTYLPPVGGASKVSAYYKPGSSEVSYSVDDTESNINIDNGQFIHTNNASANGRANNRINTILTITLIVLKTLVALPIKLLGTWENKYVVLRIRTPAFVIPNNKFAIQKKIKLLEKDIPKNAILTMIIRKIILKYVLYLLNILYIRNPANIAPKE